MWQHHSMDTNPTPSNTNHVHLGGPDARARGIAAIRAMFFPTKEPHTPKVKPLVGTPTEHRPNARRRAIRQLAIERRTTPKRIGRLVDRNPRSGLGRELTRRLEQAAG